MKPSSPMEEILAYQVQPPKCTVPRAFEPLTENELSAIESALADPTVQGTAIAKFLTSRGTHISGATVQRHRRGVCGCARG